MNREDKKAVLMGMVKGIITRSEAKQLLQSDYKDRIFRTVYYDIDHKVDLNPDKKHLKELCMKINLLYVNITRKVIR